MSIDRPGAARLLLRRAVPPAPDAPDRSLDESLTRGAGDVVLPRGYHPIGVPAGDDGYGLNIMAGPTRAWHVTIDPDDAWLMDRNTGAPKAAKEETSV